MSRAAVRFSGALIVGGLALAGGALATDAPSLFSKGLAPVDPGNTLDVDARPCAACHAGIVAEWSASRHGQAWTDPIFQREFALQPLDWCVRCHAPLATGDATSVGEVEAQGVSCAVCHIREGRMLATRRGEGSPHDTEILPTLGTPDFCAGCHQFSFPVVDPDRQVRAYTPHPMQNTVAEFHAGARADTPGGCLGCHGRSPEGHRFPGAHTDGVVAHALALDTCRDGGRLRVSLSNVGAGHAVPTGDVHRHLLLRVWRSTAPERLFSVTLGRRFGLGPDGGKVLTSDTSIPPAETRVWEVPLAPLGPADEPVNVELRYVFTVDEIPLPQNDPGEPTSFTVHQRRVAADEVPPCR